MISNAARDKLRGSKITVISMRNKPQMNADERRFIAAYLHYFRTPSFNMDTVEIIKCEKD
jgi:hypothetical protein